MEAMRADSMSDLDMAAPPWMYGTGPVLWAPPPRIAPAPPPPRAEDLDRVVKETMVDNLTDRVHLPKRVDVVHHGGEPEAGESCGLALRALWAVPLVFAAKGIKLASKPLVGCCSLGMSAPEKLCTVDEVAEAPVDSIAPPPVTGAEPKLTEAVQMSPEAAPPVATAGAQVLGAAPVPGGGDPLQPAPQLGPAQQGDPLAMLGSDGQPKPKPKAKRKMGAGASVVSMSANVQSNSGALLAGLQGGKSKSSSSGAAAPSVIGAPPASSGGSSAAAALAVAKAPPIGPPPAAPQAAAPGNNLAPAPAAGAPAPASNADGEAAPKRRPKAGGGAASKSVVSTNFASNSAASSLLGPMVARQGKAGGVRKAPSDAASAIG